MGFAGGVGRASTLSAGRGRGWERRPRRFAAQPAPRPTAVALLGKTSIEEPAAGVDSAAEKILNSQRSAALELSRCCYGMVYYFLSYFYSPPTPREQKAGIQRFLGEWKSRKVFVYFTRMWFSAAPGLTLLSACRYWSWGGKSAEVDFSHWLSNALNFLGVFSAPLQCGRGCSLFVCALLEQPLMPPASKALRSILRYQNRPPCPVYLCCRAAGCCIFFYSDPAL